MMMTRSQRDIRCYGTHILDAGNGQFGDGIVTALCEDLGDLGRQVVN